MFIFRVCKKTNCFDNSFTVSMFPYSSVLTGSALLMLYILQHRFECNYIANYSSRDLPTALLITTFWAGQEGSFLLWALFTAVIGFILQHYSQRKEMECEVMASYSLVLTFLLLLIANQVAVSICLGCRGKQYSERFYSAGRQRSQSSPPKFLDDYSPTGFIYRICFTRCSLCFAVAALWQKKYTLWMQIALPWVLFSALSLGAGLMLGGYWAYGVLGWGGGGDGSCGKLFSYSMDCRNYSY